MLIKITDQMCKTPLLERDGFYLTRTWAVHKSVAILENGLQPMEIAAYNEAWMLEQAMQKQGVFELREYLWWLGRRFVDGVEIPVGIVDKYERFRVKKTVSMYRPEKRRGTTSVKIDRKILEKVPFPAIAYLREGGSVIFDKDSKNEFKIAISIMEKSK